MSRGGLAALRRSLVCACLGLLITAGSSRADEMADLKAKMEAQQKEIQELKEMLKGTWNVIQSQTLPPVPTAAGAVAQPEAGKAPAKANEKEVNEIVGKYLKDHPGSNLPAGVQTGFVDGKGFVISSGSIVNPNAFENWTDQSRIPFEMQFHGRIQSDYYGYKVTDTRNHFTNFDTGMNTVGDESALLVKRARIWLDGTVFDPDLHYNITLDGNTRGLTGIDPRLNSFNNAIGNVQGGQGIANVDHAVRFFQGFVYYDFHPCWSWNGCGADCPEGTRRYQPTYSLIVGKQKPMFGFEEFNGGAYSAARLGGSATDQFVEYAMADWFFDADDDNLLMAAGIQIFELEDRLFVNALITNGNETQIPFLQLDHKPGLNLGFWYDFGGTWDEQRQRWQLYGQGAADLQYSCNPVVRVGAAANLVPMDRRSQYDESELDRVRTLAPTPNGSGVLTGVLNGGGISPAVAGVPGTSIFAVDAFDSYTYETFAALKWRGFSLFNDSWVRNIDNIRGQKNPATNGNRPILYSVNNVGSNALTNVALFNRGGFVDYGTLLQGGYFVIPRKLELIARYSWIRGQSGDIRGDGTFSTLSAAQVARLGIPAGTTVRLYNGAFRHFQEADELAFGFNYYFYGHNLKWTSDISFYNGGNPAGNGQAAAGFIPGVDGYLIRSQLQINF
jgi:hypothetical protein